MDSHFVFAGLQNEDVDDFVQEFERIAKVKRWSEEEKPYALQNYLSGAALEFYKFVITDEDNNYVQIIEKFKKEFRTSINYYLLLASVDMRRFATVWEFIYHTLNLARKADKNMTEVDILQFILKGMVPQLKDKLVTQVYKSVDELKAVIRQMERVYGNITEMRSFNAADLPSSSQDLYYRQPINLTGSGDQTTSRQTSQRNSNIPPSDVFYDGNSNDVAVTRYPNTRSRSFQTRGGR